MSAAAEPLREAGWPEAEAARALPFLPAFEAVVAGFPGSAGTELLRTLRYVADPAMGLRNLIRYLEAVPDRKIVVHGFLENTEYRHLVFSLFSFSQYLSDIIVEAPERLAQMFRTTALRREKSAEDYVLQLQGQTAALDWKAFRTAVQAYKRRELLRIGLRDLGEFAREDVLLRELAHLADAIVRVVYDRVVADLSEKHGEPSGAEGLAPALCVYAMGKHGSEELNFSSDVDLVFVYGCEGETEGAADAEGRRVRRISNHQFFTTAAARIVETVNEPWEGRRLYRVDTRLRPDGAAGPLAISFAAFAAYLERQGRTFEQVAWLRSRSIAGPEELSARFDEVIGKFVFRAEGRGALAQEVAALKRRIDHELLSPEDRTRDIKRGTGGIREIEFIVALHQLAHGVTDQSLRIRGTIASLDALAEKGLLPKEDAVPLRRAYFFFRRIEHTLQMMHEEQTHRLPVDLAELADLALRCGWADPAAFAELLDSERAFVHARFRHYFASGEGDPEAMGLLDYLAMGKEPAGAARDQLVRAGLDSPDALRALRELVGGTSTYAPSARGGKHIERMIPAVLAAGPRIPDPPAGVRALAQLLAEWKGASMFVELFADHPKVLAMLLRALGTGPLLPRLVLAHPEWMDDLLAGTGLVPEYEGAVRVSGEWQTAKLRFTREDALRRLRLWRQREQCLMGIAELEGTSTTAEVAEKRARLAESVLDSVVDLLRETSEVPAGRWCLFGMGGFGAGELPAVGDLDLVFVAEDDPASAFVPFVAELVRIVSEQASPGALWPVDLRLRPDGATGPLAVSAERVRRYYAREAGTWEFIALLKARPVAGNLAWGAERLAEWRGEWAARMPGREELRREIRDMRARTQAASKLPRTALFDLKRGVGGLWDIDFALAWLRLSDGDAGTPETHFGATVAELAARGRLGSEQAAALLSHSALLRTIQSMVRLLRESAEDYYPEKPAPQEVLARAVSGQLDAGQAAPAAMMARMRRMRALHEELLAT
ncbi:MAG: hypothetical protein SF028_01685 [Candidatus Sumerlaeia bacterium]|nr:hypothetical protein [Candidatus Sumerlaeia bacterium]